MSEQGALPGVDNPVDEVISQRAFAKLVGVSSPAINKAIEDGRLPADCVCPTKQGKQLYKELALAQWRYLHSNQSAVEVDQAETPRELSQAALADIADLDSIQWAKLLTKRQALIAGEKAQIAYMERCEIEGVMHRAEDVKAVWEARIENAKAQLLGISGEVCGELGIKLKKDQILVGEVIDKIIDKICAGLAGDLKPEIEEHRRRRTAKK